MAAVASGFVRLRYFPYGGYNVWMFTVTGVTTYPLNGDTYTNNGITFTIISAAAGVIVASATGIPAVTGTLARATGSGDASITFTAVNAYLDLQILIERGMTDPDEWEYFPVIKNIAVDGGTETQYKAFRREFTFVLQSQSDVNVLRQILYWSLDNNRQIDFGTETAIGVTPKEPGTFANEWLNGFKGAKQYTLVLEENIVRTVFPT